MPLERTLVRSGPPSNSLGATPFDNTESGLGGRERHIVGDYRLGEPFQSKFAEFFKRDRLFDRDGDALTNKDLPILGLRAKACGKIADGADCCISGAVSKTNLAERCIALRDAGAEPEHAAAPAPGDVNVPAASRIATAILTARSAGSGIGTGSLKNTMIPSPEN